MNNQDQVGEATKETPLLNKLRATVADNAAIKKWIVERPATPF